MLLQETFYEKHIWQQKRVFRKQVEVLSPLSLQNLLKLPQLGPNGESSVSLCMSPFHGHNSPLSSISSLISLRGGELDSIVEWSYGWLCNLGAPAALVAGAVIATIYENLNSDDAQIKKEDTKWVAFGKKMIRLLLLSAFAFEVLSIFVTTVLGTMLLSKTVESMDVKHIVTATTTPLEFMRNNFELEYLTSRITFLQGLVKWLLAISLSHIIPLQSDITSSNRKFNLFIGTVLFNVTILMLAFYNKHLAFHANYGDMLCHWFRALFKHYLWIWPPRPLMLIFVPSVLFSIYIGFQAFLDHDDGEDDELPCIPSSLKVK